MLSPSLKRSLQGERVMDGTCRLPVYSKDSRQTVGVLSRDIGCHVSSSGSSDSCEVNLLEGEAQQERRAPSQEARSRKMHEN